MSEEQPTFKVTDRRLFNADGTPREIERGEEEAKPAAQPAEQSAATAAPSASQPAQASAAATPEASRAESAGAVAGERAEGFGDEEEEEIPGADDPASFVNFLMSIASNAAASLGMMAHPATGERGVDLQLGKHWIDVLGMLQKKTEGNLAPQERQIFEGLLADLRMQYVSLTSSPPRAAGGGPRGFSARDITGGK
ncbi:MAG TPA: DUF1844 domain-containing protein [Pyrinomonadaceae bacterium]